jgi:tetratricopeptide (TPR) repeat protein
LRYFQQALELNPNDATAYQWYASTYAQMRQFNEAIPLIRRAEELDPLSLAVQSSIAVIYSFARQYDTAIVYGEKTVALEPTSVMGYWTLGSVLVRAGRPGDAIGPLEQGVAISDSDASTLTMLGCAYALAGRRADARAVERVFDHPMPKRRFTSYMRAQLAIALGEKEKSLTFLEEGCARRDGWMLETYVEPLFDPLRDDPRYKAVVQQLGFHP